MPRLSDVKNKQLQAIVSAFNFSGISSKMDNVKIVKHYRSFVGRNYKSLAQCGLFLFRDFFSNAEKHVWIAL